LTSRVANFPPKLEPLLQPARYKILYGGRGGAKSWGVARLLLALAANKRLRILCAREIMRTIADSVHRLLCDQIDALGLREYYRITDHSISSTVGSEFIFAGVRTQDVGKIKSLEGIDICWVEEAQSMSDRSWDVLIPTIRKPGSEIWMTFNPDLDTDPTHRRFVTRPPEGAVVININWEDNPWFPDVLDQERRHLEATDAEAYANVWQGKPSSSVPGAIYRHEITAAVDARRIRPVPYDPALKVHTVWDLGWNDMTSIVMVQRLHSEVRVIDFHEDSHRTLDHYVADLKERRYNWGTHYLPHDAVAKDIKSGLSAQDVLRKLGWSSEIIPAGDVEQGIKLARQMFGRCYFDEDRAAPLVEHLRRYRRQINQVTQEAMGPLHDQHSHAADAFRYAAMVVDQMRNETGWTGKIAYPQTGIV
jgi:phage terminase large subunit